MNRVAPEVRRKSARTTTSTPAHASKNPSIIPAGPPPAIQQLVEIVSTIIQRFPFCFI
jgi:hypothetical protein